MMWPGPLSAATTTGNGWQPHPFNTPLPPAPPLPDPAESQTVDRHAGLWCGCALLDCCHNELPDAEICRERNRRHYHSGDPKTGYLYPWEPGDESWREDSGLTAARRVSA